MKVEHLKKRRYGEENSL